MHLSTARAAPMSAARSIPSKSFISRNLASFGDFRHSPKSVPKAHFGTLQNSFGNPLLLPPIILSIAPGSRTLVTRFSGFPRYRFSDAKHAVSFHAHSPLQQTPSADFGARRCVACHKLSCRIADSIGGHSWRVANRQGRHLLLPMRGIECAPQLPEDV
jgi:hypothetical protein